MSVTHETVFDRLAGGYDQAFSNRVPGRWLRNRVRDRLAGLLPRPSTVLDVGCGTGSDAVWFAENGHAVVAGDVSSAMLRQTHARMAKTPDEIAKKVEVRPLDAAVALDAQLPDRSFDLVSANFGSLNCIADLDSFFAGLDGLVSPGGYVALTVMGPFCLLETVGFAVRGRFAKAARRWSGTAEYEIDGVTQAVCYHGSSAVRAAANRAFDTEYILGIGVAVPPSEFFGWCEKYPRLFRLMQAFEKRLSPLWPFSRMGDHYLIVLRRRAEGAR